MGIWSNNTCNPRIAIYNIEIGLKRELFSTNSGFQEDITSSSDLEFLKEKLENCLIMAYNNYVKSCWAYLITLNDLKLK